MSEEENSKKNKPANKQVFGVVTDLSQVKESLSGRYANKTAADFPPEEKKSFARTEVAQVPQVSQEQEIPEKTPEKTPEEKPVEEKSYSKQYDKPSYSSRNNDHPRQGNRSPRRTSEERPRTDGTSANYAEKTHTQETWAPAEDDSIKSKTPEKTQDGFFGKLLKAISSVFSSPETKAVEEVTHSPQHKKRDDSRRNHGSQRRPGNSSRPDKNYRNNRSRNDGRNRQNKPRD
jgi:hypothetical protein